MSPRAKQLLIVVLIIGAVAIAVIAGVTSIANAQRRAAIIGKAIDDGGGPTA